LSARFRATQRFEIRASTNLHVGETWWVANGKNQPMLHRLKKNAILGTIPAGPNRVDKNEVPSIALDPGHPWVQRKPIAGKHPEIHSPW
jgi:hypothetical protein